jgi:hypothetical protein
VLVVDTRPHNPSLAGSMLPAETFETGKRLIALSLAKPTECGSSFDDLRAVCLWTRTSHTLRTNYLCKSVPQWSHPSLVCKLDFVNKYFLLSLVFVLLRVKYGQIHAK